jgi:hypothetical protein
MTRAWCARSRRTWHWRAGESKAPLRVTRYRRRSGSKTSMAQLHAVSSLSANRFRSSLHCSSVKPRQIWVGSFMLAPRSAARAAPQTELSKSSILPASCTHRSPDCRINERRRIRHVFSRALVRCLRPIPLGLQLKQEVDGILLREIAPPFVSPVTRQACPDDSLNVGVPNQSFADSICDLRKHVVCGPALPKYVMDVGALLVRGRCCESRSPLRTH